MTRMIAFFLFTVSAILADPVDVNKASVSELRKVKGIGPTLAVRIIDYRKANGPFETVNDLTKVSGIGEKTLETIRDGLTVFSKTSKITAVDLNSATAEQLQILEGIGEKLALDIVEYRKANGLFRDISDLTSVKGISQTMVDKWKDQVTLKNVPPRPKVKLKLYKPPR